MLFMLDKIMTPREACDFEKSYKKHG
ncbi:hypothetical protein [Bacillus thuringiensis]